VTAQVDLLAADAADDDALVEELATLINTAYALGEAGLWTDGWERTTPARVADAVRGGGMLVASLDSRPVGCGCVQEVDESTADLGFVAADPGQWGSGVGREVVRSAEELVRSRGMTTMQLDLLVPLEWVHPEKARLRAWYTRLGYRIVRTARFEEMAQHEASQLATPCEFLVFQKAL
jgi:GNAT superfamily N-acetyltransferase